MTHQSSDTSKSKNDIARWKTSVAGMVANFSNLIFQPLENVKIRLQANDGMKNHHLPRYTGFLDTGRTMWKTEGLVYYNI